MRLCLNLVIGWNVSIDFLHVILQNSIHIIGDGVRHIWICGIGYYLNFGLLFSLQVFYEMGFKNKYRFYCSFFEGSFNLVFTGDFLLDNKMFGSINFVDYFLGFTIF
ncbi:hypothetical protein D3C72_2071120 [compost metagenome]